MTWLSLIIVLYLTTGCSSGNDAVTLNGEPVQLGDDPNAIVDTIDLPGLPTVFLGSEKGKVGMAIYQAKTGKPYLTLRDADADGVFDLLTYASLSEDGELLVEVEDYGMDGQADLIVYSDERRASVFYRGSWRDVTYVGPEQPATVKIDGESMLLEDVLHELGRNTF